jgi:hypothetical protein
MMVSPAGHPNAITTYLLEVVALLVSLDAFGGRLEAGCLCDRDNRLHDSFIAARLAERVNEASADLDAIDRDKRAAESILRPLPAGSRRQLVRIASR